MAVQATIEIPIRASAMAPGAAARIWPVQPTDAAGAWCVVCGMRPTYERLEAMASGRSLDRGEALTGGRRLRRAYTPKIAIARRLGGRGDVWSLREIGIDV